MVSKTQIALVILGTALLLAALSFWGASNSTSSDLLITPETENFQAPLTVEEQSVNNPQNINAMNPTATITTNMGVIEVELFTDTMPVTAGNFKKLAEEGFYDGTKFHRVIANFMVQGGDPNSKTSNQASWGTGNPGYVIADEHVEGELLTNTRGTISMANSGPNSGGSQFFINTVDNIHLDFNKEPFESKHPVFGRVTSGMEVVDAIGAVETGANNIPTEAVVVESITVTSN